MLRHEWIGGRTSLIESSVFLVRMLFELGAGYRCFVINLAVRDGLYISTKERSKS